MNKLNIIIINWNAGQLLDNCLDSINNSLLKKDFKYRIIVVDNNSDDNSINLIENKKYEHLTIIKNHKNLGFGAACNQGIRLTKSKFVLLLNPDTIVLKESIINSIDFLVKNPTISILGCKHLLSNEQIAPSCSYTPRPLSFIYFSLGLTKILPKVFKSPTIMTDWNHLSSRDVDQVMGAYMLMRSSILTEIGIFDERFFVYFEDADLSKRVLDFGGRIHYNSDISIIHHGKGTTEQIKDTRLFYSIRSRIKFLYKHYNFIPATIASFFSLFIEPITRITLAMIKADSSQVKAILKGYKLIYKDILSTNKR